MSIIKGIDDKKLMDFLEAFRAVSPYKEIKPRHKQTRALIKVVKDSPFVLKVLQEHIPEKKD